MLTEILHMFGDIKLTGLESDAGEQHVEESDKEIERRVEQAKRSQLAHTHQAHQDRNILLHKKCQVQLQVNLNKLKEQSDAHKSTCIFCYCIGDCPAYFYYYTLPSSRMNQEHKQFEEVENKKQS